MRKQTMFGKNSMLYGLGKKKTMILPDTDDEEEEKEDAFEKISESNEVSDESFVNTKSIKKSTFHERKSGTFKKTVT